MSKENTSPHPKKRTRPTKTAGKVVPRERKAPEATCGAKTKSGRPCMKPPLMGATRCRLHGGASPNSLDAARRRLLAAADPAAAALVGIVVDESKVKKRSGDVEWEEPSVSNSERIRAAEAVLDRAGIPRATKHEVEGDFRVAVEARKKLRSIFGDNDDS